MPRQEALSAARQARRPSTVPGAPIASHTGTLRARERPAGPRARDRRRRRSNRTRWANGQRGRPNRRREPLRNRLVNCDSRKRRQTPAPARGRDPTNIDAGDNNRQAPRPFAIARKAEPTHRDACRAGTSDKAPKSPPEAPRRAAGGSRRDGSSARIATAPEGDARRIRIDLPGMHRQHGRDASRVDRGDRPQHPARRRHAQTPPPADRHGLPEASTTNGGTSRIGPAEV